jgi:hypothetical protein
MQKIINYLKYTLLSIIFFLPVFVFAEVGNLEDFIKKVTEMMDAAVPMFLGFAALYFLWGFFGYIFNAGENKDQAREHMIWGVIMLFLIISLWGFVNILDETFDLNKAATQPNSFMPAK